MRVCVYVYVLVCVWFVYVQERRNTSEHSTAQRTAQHSAAHSIAKEKLTRDGSTPHSEKMTSSHSGVKKPPLQNS